MATRVTLTKTQAATGAGMELLSLLESVTDDGRVSNEEIGQLRAWLSRNQGSGIEAVAFLADMIERILEDGKVTDRERRELHRGIERVMPKSIRDGAVERRGTAEEVDLLGGKGAFPVAGVRHEDRHEVLEKYKVGEGTQVFLRRDIGNAFSENAIQILLSNGACIGYVPEERGGIPYASNLARLLDRGYHQVAFVEEVYGGYPPTPVVLAYLYQPNTPRQDALPPSAIPQPNGEGLPMKRTSKQPAVVRTASFAPTQGHNTGSESTHWNANAEENTNGQSGIVVKVLLAVVVVTAFLVWLVKP